MNSNDKFCGHCGAKLEVEIITPEQVEEVQTQTKKDKIPHWCQKLFAFLGLGEAILGGVLGIALGILGLCLTSKECEYRSRYVTNIVIGSIVFTLIVIFGNSWSWLPWLFV